MINTTEGHARRRGATWTRRRPAYRRARLLVAFIATLSVCAEGLVFAPPAAAANNASISGTVFNDTNGNGVLNTGEVGLVGIAVTLRNGATTVATASTNASGAYSFTKLAGATYTVTAATPVGYAGTTANPLTVVLASGQSATGRHFGFAPATASVGDTVFNDVNGNGAQDSGETGKSGVTVTLSRSGSTVGAQTTNATGNYSFTGLTAGTYTVAGTVPAGWSSTNANPRTVTLTTGQSESSADLGMWQTDASIGDTVFDDANGNGARDAGEAGVANVGLTLSKSGTTVATATTNASGSYAFGSLPAGAYSVVPAPPFGWVSTTTSPLSVTLAAGQINTAVDFGVRQSNASIGDLVWLDADGDGVRDAGEQGLAGVRVGLVARGPDAAFDTADDVVLPDVVTPGSGAYAFQNLPAATYRVSVDDASLPVGTIVAGASADPATIVLGPGQANADVDFAVRYTGTVGDRVWLDTDADGEQDGSESGLAGVTVTLSSPGTDGVLGTADDTVAATMPSSSTGSYLFERLAPGGYRVSVDTVTAPAGTAPTTAEWRDVTLAAHGAVADADFGLRWTGAVGDRVWLDGDADDAQDAGEPGAAGVVVRLLAPGPDAVRGTADDVLVASDTTGSTGLYGFVNLAPAQYRVSIDASTVPAGTRPGTPAFIDIDLAPHAALGNVDFGLRWSGAIGDLVWIDGDGDGVLDAGETGLSGARVSLVEAGPDGSLGTADDIARPDATTSASGSYAFADLPSGTYRVTVDAAASGRNLLVHGAANPATVVLGAGESRMDLDFAATPYEALTVQLDPAAVTTFAGNDTDRNIDGIGAAASFGSMLSDVALWGSVAYVSSRSGYDNHHALRRVDLATGAVTTLAGSINSYCADSTTPSSVGLGSGSVHLATDGQYLYSTCGTYGGGWNYSVRRTSLTTGATATWVGMPTGEVGGLVLAPDGYLYVTHGVTVYRIDRATGARTVFTTVPVSVAHILGAVDADAAALWATAYDSAAGTWSKVVRISLANGAATTVLPTTPGFNSWKGIASAGSFLYLTKSDNHALVRLTKSDGTTAIVAGNGSPGFADGVEFDAWLSGPGALASDGASLWIADQGNKRLRKAAPGPARPSSPPDPPGTVDLNPAAVTTLAGGTYTYDRNIDGVGSAASFGNQWSDVVLWGGAAFASVRASYDNHHALRRVDLATGAVTTLAGSINSYCTDSTTPSAVGFGTGSVHLATDGQYLYSTCGTYGGGWNYSLRRTSLATGATTSFGSFPTGDVAGLVLAPDGYLYATQGATVYRFDRVTGARTVFATVPVSVAYMVGALDADAAALWATAYDSTSSAWSKVVRISLADGTATTVLPTTPGITTLKGIASSGSFLYVTKTDNSALMRLSKADGALAIVAGNGSPGFADGIEFDAWFDNPGPLASDGAALWIGDQGNKRLRKATPGAPRPSSPPAPAGTVDLNPAAVTTLAGNSTDVYGRNTDGVGSAASFGSQWSDVVLWGGTAFASVRSSYDGNHSIRRVDLATGAVTTLAGSIGTFCTESATASAVTFGSGNVHMAVDGQYLYSTCGTYSGGWFYRLRRTSLTTGATHSIATFPTTSDVGGLVLAPDGYLYGTQGATVYRFDRITGARSVFTTVPTSVANAVGALDADGDALWVLGFDSSAGAWSRVVRVSLVNGAATTVLPTTPGFTTLKAIASSGSFLYLTKTDNSALMRLSKADGALAIVAGNGSPGFADGTEFDAWFDNPGPLASDGAALWIGDQGNRRLRKAVPGTPRPTSAPPVPGIVDINPAAVTTVAGSSDVYGRNIDGVGSAASFGNQWSDVALWGGTAFVSVRSSYDGNHSVRRVDLATGAVTTLAGSVSSYCTDSPTASAVGFGHGNVHLAVDGQYLYSTCGTYGGGWFYRLRRTSLATGATQSIATFPSAGDISSLVLAPDGYLYSTQGLIVYRFDRVTGVRTVFATVSTSIANAVGALDVDGDALWALGFDSSAGAWSRVLRISLANGAVTTLLPTTPGITSLKGIASSGSLLYLTKTDNHALVRLSKTDGAWSIVAGNGSGGYADGIEYDAWFENPGPLASDGQALWIGDQGNRRLRKALPGTPRPTSTPAVPPTINTNPAAVSTFAGNGNDRNTDGIGTSAGFGNTFLGIALHNGAAYLAARSGYDGNRSVRRVDVATGAVTTVAGSNSIYCVDSPTASVVGFGHGNVRLAVDGQYAYSTCGTYSGGWYFTLRRTSLTTGATHTFLSFPAGDVNGLVLAPDGYLYATQGLYVYRIDRLTGVRTIFATVPSTVANVLGDLTVDGDALWTTGYDSGTSSWSKVVRVSLASGQPTLVTPAGAMTGLTGITSSGSYLYLTASSPSGIFQVVKSTGAAVRVAGGVPISGGGTIADGTGDGAWFNTPGPLASDGGALWIGDSGNGRLRKAVKGKLAAEDGGPTRFGETFGGGNPTGMYDPCACADPVSIETGNYYENNVDIAIPSRGPGLGWTRSYNSQAAAVDGALGWGWSHGYQARIVDDPYEAGVKTVVQENGSRVSFTPGPNGWTAPSRVLATLTTNGDGSYTFARRDKEFLDFTSTGALWRIRDLNGYATTMSYDGTGKLTTVTEPAGRTLAITYNGTRVSRVQDQTGRGVSYAYDAAGNLTDITDVRGGNTRYTYSGGHLVLTVRDQRLGVVTNTYDTARRVVTQTDQLNRTTTFAYTESTTTVTNPRGYATVYQMADGMLTGITRSAGTAAVATWTYQYDSDTLALAATIGPGGREVSATYDDAGNLLTSTDALDHTMSYTYNALGQVLTATDPSGVTTTNTYDGAGNLLTTSRPLTGTSQVQTTTYTYGDPAHPGDITMVTEPNGKQRTYSYDVHGNAVTDVDPMGNTMTHVYDTLGRRTSTVSSLGNVAGANPADYRTTYVYNAAGAVTSVTDPLGKVTTMGYDPSGNRTRVTDPDNKVTLFTFDLVNQMTVVTRPDLTTLGYGYDANGNRTSDTNAANRTTTYGYDALDRLSTTTDPLNRVTTVTYNAAGDRETVIDAAGGFATSGYDAGGRTTSIAYSGGSTPGVSFAYDSLGRRTSMTDGTGTSTFVWDSLGRLKSSTNGAGATVGYQWDIANRLTAIAYPGGATVANGYDDAGRLTSVTDWLQQATSFQYDADSRMIGTTRPNGTTESYTFNRAGRITAVDHLRSGTSFSSFTYGRDNSGQVTSATVTGNPQPNETYGYSPLDQLKTINADTLAYDGADNVTTRGPGMTLAYDVADQLVSSTLSGPTTTYGYDGRGNRTSVTPPAGSPLSLTWDQGNRMTGYGGAATYAYNGEGLRTAKTVSGTTTPFVWAALGGVPLLLKDGADSYVYGPGGTPLQRIAADGTTTYLHVDQLGSVRALTDGAGAVVGTFAYDPFGQPTGATGTATVPFGFAGQYRDAESGLVYMRARYYDPVTAQFLGRDPLVAETGAAHAYASNNPLNRVDPLGLAAQGTPTFTSRQGQFVAHIQTTPPQPGMSCEDYQAYLRVAATYSQQKADHQYYEYAAAQEARAARRAAMLREAAELKRQAEADRRAAEAPLWKRMADDPQYQYVDDWVSAWSIGAACVLGATAAPVTAGMAATACVYAVVDSGGITT